MKVFYLFRTNLKNRESYHSITDLETFKNECWDFYCLQGIYFLENNIYDKFVVWRLSDNDLPDINFNVNGKEFIQRWVKDFNEVFNYEKPYISLFRGGFCDYDEITKKNPDFFGKKLYLGSSKRVTPQYGGVYDKILVESDIDRLLNVGSIPFYKTANPNIFKPLTDKQIHFDICWVANFAQLRHKGHQYFIEEIAKSKNLSHLKIVHIGNNPDVGKHLCKENNVFNISFFGPKTRPEINEILNMSKCGIVTSNEQDGCPRVITEILCSGTPLLVRNKTRLLSYYNEEQRACHVFPDNMLESYINSTMYNWPSYKKWTIKNLENLTMDKICSLNVKVWESI